MITDPRDGSLVGELAVTEASEIPGIVEAGRRAFASWGTTDPAARGLAVRALGHALLEHADELAELNARETGKPRDEALGGVRAGADTLLQYAELGPLHVGDRLRGSIGAVDYSIHEPRGVVVALTPWNDPVAIAAGLIGAALVTGNVVVHKPSERCPHLGLRLGQILADGLPEGVLSTVTGTGAAGAALLEQRIDVVAHVGSSSTGAAIARRAAAAGIHVVRENGGDDALIVDADVDPVWAAEQTALGAFVNAGQLCTAVERVIVVESIADAFLAALEEQARSWEPRIGPLVDERARRSVHEQVAASVGLGARVLTGGTVPEGPGCFYPPTVLTECTPGMPVVTEETFGPVAPVLVVPDFDAALDLAAADRFGLAATVLTGSMEHAHRAAAELPVGTVKVNAVFGGAPGGSAQPRGASGSGFGYGPALLDEFTSTKVVHLGLPRLAG